MEHREKLTVGSQPGIQGPAQNTGPMSMQQAYYQHHVVHTTGASSNIPVGEDASNNSSLQVPVNQRTTQAVQAKLPAKDYQALSDSMYMALFIFGSNPWINWPSVMDTMVPDGSGQTFAQRFGICKTLLSDEDALQDKLYELNNENPGHQIYYWLLVVLRESLAKSSADASQEIPAHRYLLFYLRQHKDLQNKGDAVTQLLQTFPEHPFLSEKIGLIASNHKLSDEHYSVLHSAIENAVSDIVTHHSQGFEAVVEFMREQRLWDNDDDQKFTVRNPDWRQKQQFKEQLMPILEAKGPAADFCFLMALKQAGMEKGCQSVLDKVSSPQLKTGLTGAADARLEEPSVKEEGDIDKMLLDNRLGDATIKLNNDLVTLMRFCLQIQNNRRFTAIQRNYFINKAQQLIRKFEGDGQKLAKERKQKACWMDIYCHPFIHHISQFEHSRNEAISELKTELNETAAIIQKAKEAEKQKAAFPTRTGAEVAQDQLEAKIRQEVMEEMGLDVAAKEALIALQQDQLDKFNWITAKRLQDQQAQIDKDLHQQNQLIQLQLKYNQAVAEFMESKRSITETMGQKHADEIEALKADFERKLKAVKEKASKPVVKFPCSICFDYYSQEYMRIFRCCGQWFCTTCTDKVRKMADNYLQPFACAFCRKELQNNDVVPVRVDDVIVATETDKPVS